MNATNIMKDDYHGFNLTFRPERFDRPELTAEGLNAEGLTITGSAELTVEDLNWSTGSFNIQ